jgi:GT2 family glycosyltransferase
VKAERNWGFAKGCNLGVHHSQNPYVAFLNNDTKVHPEWLISLVEALQQDQEAVCAAAKILDWEGKTIDFVEGQLNFHGFARQVAWRTEVEANLFDERKSILFACGGSMLIDRRVFIEAGEFDEDYFMFFEDVDLGWRLWALGYKVVFVPEAITYHRHHGSVEGVMRSRRLFLYERNALATIIKNYEQANLNKILPVALFLAIHRATNHLKRSGFYSEALYPANWANPNMSLSKQAVSMGQLISLMAAQDVMHNIQNLMKKREIIQNKRKRSDQEIVALFGQPLLIDSTSLEFDGDYALAQESLGDAFQLAPIFQKVGKQILFLTKSGLPKFGFSPTPEGLRVQAIGQGLETEGHHVSYSMPAEVVGNQPLSSRLKRLVWDKNSLENIVTTIKPDILIICHPEIVPLVRLGIYRPVVLDYSPISPTPDGAAMASLLNIDLFICSTEEQKTVLRMQLNREGIYVAPEQIQIVPATVSADGSIGGLEPLHLFCQKPLMTKKKLKIRPNSLLSLPFKALQIAREKGFRELKANFSKYITWRLHEIKNARSRF